MIESLTGNNEEGKKFTQNIVVDNLDCSVHKKDDHGSLVHISGSKFGPKGVDFDIAVHDPEREVISMTISKEGCFECHILRSLLNALENSPKETSLIDIGGNIGMYSLHVASRGRNVVAFEPLKLNQERFCTSILKNANFENRIKLIPRALTDDARTKYVDFNKDAFNTAVFRRQKGQKNYGVMKTADIKNTGEGNIEPPKGEVGEDYALAITVDSLQQSNGMILPTPGSSVVLKVDVEGSECKALSGAFDYLRKVTIEYVALEMQPHRIMACQKDGMIDKMHELFIKKNGLEAYKFITKGPQGNTWIKINWEKPEEWNVDNVYDLAFSKGTPSIE